MVWFPTRVVSSLTIMMILALAACAPAVPPSPTPTRPAAQPTLAVDVTPIVLDANRLRQPVPPTLAPAPTPAFESPAAPVSLSALITQVNVTQRVITIEGPTGDIERIQVPADAKMLDVTGAEITLSDVRPGGMVQAWGSLDGATDLAAIQIVVTPAEP